MTRLRAGRSGVRNSAGGRNYLLSKTFRTPIPWVGGDLAQGVHWPARKVEHSVPSSAEFKSEGCTYPFVLPAFIGSSETTLQCFCAELAFWPSRWPRGLRGRSVVTRLLGLRVRISPAAWMSVSCDCFVFSRRGICDGLIPRAEESCQVRACVGRWVC